MVADLAFALTVVAMCFCGFAAVIAILSLRPWPDWWLVARSVALAASCAAWLALIVWVA